MRPSPRQIALVLAGILAGALLFLTGYLEGLRRSPHGEPLRLTRDEDDAACLEVLHAELKRWD